MSNKMEPKTLEALKGSIAKWKAIVDGTGSDKGIDNCPLCLLFNGNTKETYLCCEGCPVAEKTGDRGGCEGTPYIKWAHLNKVCWTPGCEVFAKTPEQKQAAQAELDFLISLLPEGETP